MSANKRLGFVLAASLCAFVLGGCSDAKTTPPATMSGNQPVDAPKDKDTIKPKAGESGTFTLTPVK